MATRDSSRVERRRARLDGNRPRTHPKHSGRKAGDALDRPVPCTDWLAHHGCPRRRTRAARG